MRANTISFTSWILWAAVSSVFADPALDGWQEATDVAPGGVPTSTWWESQSVTPTRDYLSAVDLFITAGLSNWNATVDVYGQTTDHGTSLSTLLGTSTLTLSSNPNGEWYTFDFSNIDIANYTDATGAGRLLLVLKSDDASAGQRYVFGGNTYNGGTWRYTPNSGASFVTRNSDMTFRLYTDSGDEPPPHQFVQDRFAIGYWNSVPVDGNLDNYFADIAAANFTLAIAGYNESNAQAELAMLQKYDLRGLFWRATKEVMDAPEVWGKVMADEPQASEFSELARLSTAFKNLYPDKLAYINLLPNYATPAQLGTANYIQYVDSYMQQVNPEVLSVDNYPGFPPGGDTRQRFLDNLEIMRQRANDQDIPFWNYVNVMGFGAIPDPTEPQIRWQVFASVAYGSKGILYFCYYAPSFATGGGILDQNGNKTPHYAHVQAINSELRALGPTLMQLTGTGVVAVNGTSSGSLLNGTLIQSLHSPETGDPPLDLLVGLFDHINGYDAVLLVNNDYENSLWMTIEWHGDVLEIDSVTGLPIVVVDENLLLAGLQISLQPGGGRLFTAVPEPSSLLIIVVVAGALAGRRLPRRYAAA